MAFPFNLPSFACSLIQSQAGTATAPYEYAPLPTPRSLRLLEIEQAEGDIQCTLHAADLEDSPQYDALSYTWGDPRPPLLQTIAPAQYQRRFAVVCDGRALSVTANLYYALLRLRSMAGSGLASDGTAFQARIWIDAICIDQSNLAERSAQVAMMDEIYKRAATVIVWLGKEDRYTEPAFRVICQLSAIPEDRIPHYLTLGLDNYGIPESDWEAFTALFARAWFNRAWVVQEVVLAPRLLVQCGPFQMPWETLRGCSTFIMKAGTWRHLGILASQFAGTEDRIARSSIRPAASGSVALLDSFKEGIRSGTFASWQLMMLGRGFGATDPRDRVYGFLGLVREARRLSLNGPENGLPAPDYSKSVETIFEECAAFLLSETKNLLLLSTVEDRSVQSRDLADSLPSWVPDMTVPLRPHPLLMESPSPPRPSWDPANEGPKATAIAVPAGDGKLYLRGAYFDTIADVSGPLDQLESDFNWADVLDFTRPLWSSTTSGTTLGAALCKTLIADTAWSLEQHPAGATVERAFAEMLASRLVLLSVASMDPFPVQQYAAVRTKLLRGAWDQVREDPTAFWAGPADVRQAAAAQRARMHEAEREHVRKRAGRGEAIRSLYARAHALLMELSSVDSDVFLKPEEVHQVLGIMFGPESPQKTEMRTRIDAYRQQMKPITGTRRLFRTVGNYLGIGAMSARLGDQVWILPGQNVPFILRSAGEREFTLVGEGYVHGIMHGEAAANGELHFMDITMI